MGLTIAKVIESELGRGYLTEEGIDPKIGDFVRRSEVFHHEWAEGKDGQGLTCVMLVEQVGIVLHETKGKKLYRCDREFLNENFEIVNI